MALTKFKHIEEINFSRIQSFFIYMRWTLQQQNEQKNIMIKISSKRDHLPINFFKSRKYVNSVRTKTTAKRKI